MHHFLALLPENNAILWSLQLGMEILANLTWKSCYRRAEGRTFAPQNF